MKFSKSLTLFLLAFLVLGITSQVDAQEDKSKRKSPPAVATASTGGLTITIDYSSPAVKGRKVVGNLIPNGKVWRLGANEATTFEVDQTVMINGNILKPGKYAMFVEQDGGDWTYIFNKNPDQWGAYKYDKSLDALRVDVSPAKSSDFAERMKFDIQETKAGEAVVVFNWENIETEFKVLFAK
ncbi:MAG: DUF2911 domain-containing protein [Bacteroidota bacterium]